MQYAASFMIIGCICNLGGCNSDDHVTGPTTTWEAQISEIEFHELTRGNTDCEHHHYQFKTEVVKNGVTTYEFKKLYVNEHHHADILKKVKESDAGLHQVNYRETEYGQEVISFYRKD